MKTWIKYGLIGIGISIIFSIFLFIWNLLIGMPITIIMQFFGLKMYDPSYDRIAFWIGGVLNPIIVWFIIGAIIGLIIGKIKSRREQI